MIQGNQPYPKVKNSPFRVRRKVNSCSRGAALDISSLKSSPRVKKQSGNLHLPQSYSASYMNFLNHSEVKAPYKALEGYNSRVRPRRHQHLPDIITEKRGLIREILNKSVKNRKGGNLSRDFYNL